MSITLEHKRPPALLEKPPVPPAASPRAGRLRDLAVVAPPTVLALILCLFDLTARNLWLDEAATVSIVSQHGAAFGAALAHDGGNMLGYYGLLHVLVGAFGHGPLVIRLPSALAAAATVTLTSLIALRLFDRRVALLSGLLAAVSLSLVYWGQEARGYTVMIALLCASTLLLVIALERPRAGWGIWLSYVAVSTAAVYAGLEAVLLFGAQIIVLIWHRRRIRSVLGALVVIMLCCIPLAVLAVNRGASQIFWIPLPNSFTTKQVLLTLSSGGLEPQFYSASGDALRWLTEALMALCAGAILWQLFRRRTRPQAWKPALVLAWLLVPGILAWVISELGHSMFEARYLLMSLPAVALLLGWMLSGLWRLGSRSALAGTTAARWLQQRGGGSVLLSAGTVALRGSALALLVALLTLRALQLAPSYGVSTEPWRAVTRQVLALSHRGDCIAFYPLDSRMPFRYYLPDSAPAPRSVLPAVPWSQVRPYVERYATLSRSQITRAATSCRRFWLISSHQGHQDGTTGGTVHYERFVALKSELARQYRHSVTATYGAASIITVDLFSTPARAVRS